jgi:hypothetical protein
MTSTRSRKLPIVARVVLGLPLFVFGLNGFLHFLPEPHMPAAAASFATALFSRPYMLALVKGTEVIAGALLLSNRYVPLALALVAPVVVNIVAFHAFLAPAGLAVPLLLLAAELYLAWSYRSAFAPMLRAVTPADAPATIAAPATPAHAS